MDDFDFSGLRLDLAATSGATLAPVIDFIQFIHRRRLCSKRYLKAETQQVDQILEELSSTKVSAILDAYHPSP